MSSLLQLQQWYAAQCDGDWEHSFGVSIDTLDNPGWTIRIDLKGTPLESRLFQPHRLGVGENTEPEDQNWMSCEVNNNQFVGAGGPHKLEELLEVFLRWAHSDA